MENGQVDSDMGKANQVSKTRVNTLVILIWGKPMERVGLNFQMEESMKVSGIVITAMVQEHLEKLMDQSTMVSGICMFNKGGLKLLRLKKKRSTNDSTTNKGNQDSASWFGKKITVNTQGNGKTTCFKVLGNTSGTKIDSSTLVVTKTT